MGLTALEKVAITKALAASAGEQGVPITEEIGAYLVAVIANDLKLAKKMPELPNVVAPFFSPDPTALQLPGLEFWPLITKLKELDGNAVTFFCCLATLHKSRLKYARILSTQPIPTMDQACLSGCFPTTCRQPCRQPPHLNRKLMKTGLLAPFLGSAA